MIPPTTPEAPLPRLDAEEAELLRSFEAGEWRPVPQMEQEIARYAASRAGAPPERDRAGVADTARAPGVNRE